VPQAVAAATRSFRATPDQVAEIDTWIETTAAGWNLAEDVVFRARVCVAELAANVMEHGRAQADWDEIAVTLHPSPPDLELEIADTGRPFDPTRPPAPAAAPPATESIGGRGLRLLRAYATAMAYRREGARNILSLRVAPAARNP
jgi:anti-sigma regulatory factor (Ser/Thr protein kinase)